MDESLLPKELRTKPDDKTPQKANKAIAGSAHVKKPGLRKKILDVFAVEDLGSVREYIFWEQIVPSLQEGLYNVISNTIAMIFWGNTARARKGTRRSNANWSPNEATFSYDRVNERRGGSRRDDGYSSRRPSSARLDEITVDTHGDAQAVLEELTAYMEQYGRVPVSAYYEAFGISRNGVWTDARWGWTSLAEARVVPAHGGGWTVYLPDPEAF